MMESKEESSDGGKAAAQTLHPPNHGESIDDGTGPDLLSVWCWMLMEDRESSQEAAAADVASLNKNSVDGDSMSTNEFGTQDRSDTVGDPPSNVPAGDPIAEEGKALRTNDQAEMDAESSTVKHKNIPYEEEETGYNGLVQSVLNCLAMYGGAHGGEPGQSTRLSSDIFNRESEHSSLIQNMTSLAKSPSQIIIPGMDVLHGEHNPKDESLSVAPTSEDSTQPSAQSEPPGSNCSGTEVTPLDPQTDNDPNIPGATHKPNDLDHSDGPLDSDDDETPSNGVGSPMESNGLEKLHPYGGPTNPGMRAEAKEPHRINQSYCNGTSPKAGASSNKFGWRRNPYPADISQNQLDSRSNVNAPDLPSNGLGMTFNLNEFPSLPQSRHGNIQEQWIKSSIQLPTPRNLWAHRWSAESIQSFKLGPSGYSYEGGIRRNKMDGHGRLIIDERQFLEGNWSMNRLVKLKFCQLTLRDNQTVFIVRRLEDYLLSIHEVHFVATVTIDPYDELDLTVTIPTFKKSLLQKITVVDILADEFIHKRQVSLNEFERVLQRMVGEDANPIVRATVLILLGKSLKKSQFTLSDLVHDITTPENLRVAANGLLRSESNYHNNSPSYLLNTPAKPAPLDMKGIMSKIYIDSISKHRQGLVSRCPDALPGLASEIQKLDDDSIVYVTKEDLAVFDHIVTQPCFEPYKGFFENLVAKFCLAIAQIRPYTSPSDVMPLLLPVYGFLVKSFWEIILEIIEATEGYKPEDMLKCESGDWKPAADIKLSEDVTDENHSLFKFFKSSKKKSSLQQKSLVTQYKILFEMLKTFSPESSIGERKFESKSFLILDQSLSWWEKGLLKVGKSVGLAKRLKNWSLERLAWIDLLDITLHNVLKDEANHQILLKPYTLLLEGHISSIEKSTTDNHELFRMMTHNIIKFITSSVSYFQDSRGKPGVDVDILVQQIWTFSAAAQDIERNHLGLSNSRDLIAEYNRYLSLRRFIDIEPKPGYFSSQISGIMQTFMRIVAASLKKPVPTSVLVSYLRSLNDFLSDFKNIDFLGSWYVKSRFYDPDVMEKIENKLAENLKCSYRVKDVDTYVVGFQLLRHQPPDHYIIQIVTKLLDCIETCLGKQWVSDQLPVAQLESASLLLDAIRRSFMYLKEQPDYVDFESFKKESVEPFVRMVTECSTIDSLTKRINIVRESFWYIRKMDEISIDQALAMFTSANTCPDSDKILACYNLYLEHYEKYVAEYNCSISSGNSHLEGLKAVEEILDLRAEPFHHSEWTEEFKTCKIPIILAGLSAIWSILVSQDISSTGKFLKPHCIQIIGVLKLLGVDSTEGVASHLAQVLTGQGKSVILALLSSILALTGHQVRVVCYSEYLSSRDEEDFEELFDIFQITNEIRYGTFEEMADSLMSPTWNGVRTSLRSLIEKKVLTHADWSTLGSLKTESKETVLLIDEVDVFFTQDFYGNSYYPCHRLALPGLDAVQKKVWTLASSEIPPNAGEISQLCEKFIENEVAAKNPLMLALVAFLNKPGTFSLLYCGNDGYFVKEYSNQSLFKEHLQRMVNDAINVVGSSNDNRVRSHFRLNNEEMICCKRPDNIYSPSSFLGYFNTFNYFRLKQSNFDSKNSTNYGYLLLNAGSISYARLPSEYHLILGVSGTATNLGKYEQSGLEAYGINKLSILPSFYGDSNLKFNSEQDFHYYNDAQGWLKKIYDRANHMVLSHRAVLIFFESDETMNVFSEEYTGKFERMNKITVNTVAIDRDVYVEEAGLSGAVTLATRDMGRGVDYKSSLSVEKNGGVHVIQTFYSTDVKEEVQIKGRTARKDNRGSYEMVICKEHLVKTRIITKEDNTIHTYTSLGDIRKRLCDELGKTVTAKIRKCEREHITTMKYFGLM